MADLLWVLLAGGLNSEGHAGEHVTRMPVLHGQLGAPHLSARLRWSAGVPELNIWERLSGG